MIDSNQFHTVVFKNLTDTEREKLIYHDKFSAGSYSHALNDRDDALFMLSHVESVLTSINDSDAEEQAKQALLRIRDLLRKHGRHPKPHKSFQDVLNECYSGILS